MESFPSSMCPSNPRTLSVVKSLIRQIVSFHPDIQYLHIGCDEVWHLGLCLVCSKRAAASKYGKYSLYLEHILTIAQYIQETYPYLKIIIWDDMLRSIDLQVLNGISIACSRHSICMGFYIQLVFSFLQNTILENMWNPWYGITIPGIILRCLTV